MIEKTREWLERNYQKETDIFWDRKARFTYYIVTLPFALLAGSVASYKPPLNIETYEIFLEISAWLLFLASGLSGLSSKWGEMESARLSSVIAQNNIMSWDLDEKGQERTAADAELSINQRTKLHKAEKFETVGNRFLYLLFPMACVVWLFSRIQLQF